MLQHIKPDRVELGMFVHGFVGSWFDHPFWRKKFVIEDEDDLVKIRESKVDAVIVDDERGTGPRIDRPAVTPVEPEPVRRLATQPNPMTTRYTPPSIVAKNTGFKQEAKRAARIVEKSKK